MRCTRSLRPRISFTMEGLSPGGSTQIRDQDSALLSGIEERKQMETAMQKSEKTARQLAKENAVVAEIGRIIGSTLDIEEVYERFAEEVRKIIPFDRIVINLIDTEKNTFSNAYVTGIGIEDRKAGAVYPLKGSANFEMISTQSSLLVQTEDPDEYRDRFPTLLSTFQAGFRSIMNVPLFSKGKIIGGLLLRSLKPHAYTDRDVRLAEKVGNQIAGAIANAHLFRELREAEERLKEKTEALARSNKELEQFAYVASHDLQEPLRMVTSYVQLLARRYKGRLDGDADEFIAFAVDGAARMKCLINDLLTYSRVGTRGKPFEPTECETVFGQSVDNLRVAIEESGAAITHDLLPRVMADPVQLGQLFQNLIANAIKFRNEKPPGIHVSARREEKE
ncbi:MAG: GAF domain-containing sensor histidine kinase, partial [Deltaproteobacteria bacterium]